MGIDGKRVEAAGNRIEAGGKRFMCDGKRMMSDGKSIENTLAAARLTCDVGRNSLAASILVDGLEADPRSVVATESAAYATTFRIEVRLSRLGSAGSALR
jgi:hypothetical protein